MFAGGWKCARCTGSYMRQPAGQLGRAIGHAPTREGDFHSALPGDDQRGLALSLIRICIVLLCIAQSPRTGVPQLAQRSCICSPCVSAKPEATVTSLGDRGRLESSAGLPQPSPRNAALCHDPASTLCWLLCQEKQTEKQRHSALEALQDCAPRTFRESRSDEVC